MSSLSLTQEGDLECTQGQEFIIQLHSCVVWERSSWGLSNNTY